MLVAEAQREVRTVYAGGLAGQLVSSALWLAAAALGTWSSTRAAIVMLIGGGFFIFPLTQAALRLSGRRASLSEENPLRQLAIQVAFVLPLSMPLLAPVTVHRVGLFFPAMTVLLGAHYLPFTFLYGMRAFVPLSATLVGGGVVIAMRHPDAFAVAGWFTAVVLAVFALIGYSEARRAGQ